MFSHKQNHWKGFVLGALGGIAGVIAMRYYWKAATALAGQDPRKAGKPDDDEPGPLDSISLIGTHHKEGESSTAAVGRIAYRLVTGKDPESQETRTTLSYLVHWIFSMFVSGLYGAIRGPVDVQDIQGGLALGVGLWFFGDELTMPLLGLTDGPTAYPAELHAHSLAAHVVYGLASAAGTQALHQLFD